MILTSVDSILMMEKRKCIIDSKEMVENGLMLTEVLHHHEMEDFH